MATPKLYYHAGVRGEAEAIRLLFKELGQVCILSSMHRIVLFERRWVGKNSNPNESRKKKNTQEKEKRVVLSVTGV